MSRPAPVDTATKLWQQRLQDAKALFCSGSVVRGEGSPHSDLDIVVLFDSVSNAWRESLVVDDWPVELFVHDLETLAHFVRDDVRDHRPSLLSMLSDAIVIPQPSSLTDDLQAWARRILRSPPALGDDVLQSHRYLVSDLLDDLRDPRPRPELLAIATRLHERLADYLLKTSGRWSARGKHLPRALQQLDPDIAHDFDSAFDAVFVNSDPQPLIALTERILRPFGGPLFDGYHSAAPASARTDPPAFGP